MPQGQRLGNGKVLALSCHARDAQGEPGASPSEEALRPCGCPILPGLAEPQRGPGSSLRCSGPDSRLPERLAGLLVRGQDVEECGGWAGPSDIPERSTRLPCSPPRAPARPACQTLRGPTSAPGRQGQAGNVICVLAASSHPAPVHPEAWSGTCFSLCPAKWVFQRGSRRTRLLSFVSGGF